MKLPTQAQPIMRTATSIGISEAPMSGVTASECNTKDCAMAIGACVVTAAFGPAAVMACLIATGALDCRDCIGEVLLRQHEQLPPRKGDPLL